MDPFHGETHSFAAHCERWDGLSRRSLPKLASRIGRAPQSRQGPGWPGTRSLENSAIPTGVLGKPHGRAATLNAQSQSRQTVHQRRLD